MNRREQRIRLGLPVGPERRLEWLWCMLVGHRWRTLFAVRVSSFRWFDADISQPIEPVRPRIAPAGRECERCGQRVSA